MVFDDFVRDREAVLSPAWSVHCGAGTGAYRFVWAMGGENQAFEDMKAGRVIRTPREEREEERKVVRLSRPKGAAGKKRRKR